MGKIIKIYKPLIYANRTDALEYVYDWYNWPNWLNWRNKTYKEETGEKKLKIYLKKAENEL